MHKSKIFDTQLRQSTFDPNILQIDSIFKPEMPKTPNKQMATPNKQMATLAQSIHLESQGNQLQIPQKSTKQYKICESSIYHQSGSPIKENPQIKTQEQTQEQLQKVYEMFQKMTQKMNSKDPFGLEKMHIPLKLTAFWKYPLYEEMIKVYQNQDKQQVNDQKIPNQQQQIQESDCLHLKEFMNLLSQFAASQKLFSDQQFPAIQNSISKDPNKQFAYSSDQKSKTIWLRPKDIFQGATYYVFNDPPEQHLTPNERKAMKWKQREEIAQQDWRYSAISPEDIKQGALGDCYFLAALSALAEFPERIKPIFVNTEVNDSGAYAMKFIVFGQLTAIVVDDFFPCNNHHQPIFTSSNGQELWVLLLEKAWAKIFGSYEIIEGGLPREVLHALTGAPTMTFSPQRLSDDESWKIVNLKIINCLQQMVEADKQNFILATGTTSLTEQEQNELGIVPGHAYTLISCFEVERHKLLLLRNPWGGTEWKGKWSDNSPLWTESMRRACGQKSVDDGLFFMEYNDFKTYFILFEICYYHDNYLYCSITGKQQSLTHACCFSMTVTTPGKYYISVHQKHDRFYQELERYNYSNIKLLVAKKNGNSYQYVDGIMDQHYEEWITSNLSSGEYIIYVKPYWYDKNQQREFVVSSYGPGKTTFKTISKPADFINKAFLNAPKTEQSSNENEIIYSLSQDFQKGFGYLWVKNQSNNQSFSVNKQFSNAQGYKFRKPSRGNNVKFVLKPQEEQVAVFNLYQMIKVAIESQNIQKLANQQPVHNKVESQLQQISNQNVNQINQVFSIFLNKNQTEFEKKLQHQIALKKPFQDSEFPAENASISVNPQRKFAYQKGDLKSVWMRPQQIFNNKPFSVFDQPPDQEMTVQERKEMKWKDRENNVDNDWRKSAISPEDIQQGALGDCYFLAALASCAEFQERIIQIFLNTQVNEVGMYGMKLYVEGEIQTIVVDDQFPCTGQGHPMFSSAHGSEIWVLLLEKAWAKIYGSYENIEAGYTREALYALTGAPTKVFYIEDLRDQEAFETLAQADKNNFILATGSNSLTKEQEEEFGLIEGHAYTIISCFNAEGNQLILLRNPWGQTEWKGKWSDNSTAWTASLRKICGHTKSANDGLFFMEYADFKNFFSSFEICYYHDNYAYTSKKGKQTQLKQACCFDMQVSTAGEYYISVHQKNSRFFPEADNYEYSSIKLLLAKKIDNNNYEYIDGKMSKDYEFWIESVLQPGHYVIYVRPYWQNQNVQQTFTVSSYGPSQTIISSIPKPNNFLSSAFLHKEKNPQKSNSEQTLLYELYQDYKKGFGYYWARNEGSSKAIEITAKFKQTEGYQFKKPIQGFNAVFNLQPKKEQLTVFSIYNTARTTIVMTAQSIKKI